MTFTELKNLLGSPTTSNHSRSPLVTTTKYTGTGPLIDVNYDSSNSSSRGTYGAVTTNSWSNSLPSYLNPGLFTGWTASPTSDSLWYGVAVRQTGGTLTRGSFAMRGGVKTGGVSAGFNILEIDDAENWNGTSFDYTNLDISGFHTMWNQNPGDNTLSVLNGWAHVGALNATNSGANFVNIGDGKLDVGYFRGAKLTVNMLAGGTGQFNLDDMADVGNWGANADLGNMILNFETGSLGSMTIGHDGIGGDAGDYWANNFTVGDVQIDGVNVEDLSAFTITDFGEFGTTISLPTLPVIALLGDDPVTIEVGDTYIDAGATATDNYDGDITSSIETVSPVNTDVVGVYTLTYNVTDANGNVAVEVTRTVNVVFTINNPLLSKMNKDIRDLKSANLSRKRELATIIKTMKK